MNLWIVHYAHAEQNDICLANQIPYTPDIQNTMTARNFFQSCGAIERKEFMLSDRGKWPRINRPQPQGVNPARGGMYAPIQSRRAVPQQMVYPPTAPPAARSRRPMPPGPHAAGQGVPDFAEDEQHQDVFDVLTPRDIALVRYRQNHEWLEEVISSAYSIYKIEPPDLGLGLRGHLAPLTDGIFHAPGGDAHKDYPDKTYTGKLDEGLADEFRKRVKEHIDSETAEIEKMKEEHAKSMASFKAGSVLLQAEKDLRLSVEERGPEFWRLEGRTTDGEEGGSSWSQKHNKKVEDIVAQVEAQLGRNIAALNEVSRIQDGGYQEPAPLPAKEPTPVLAQPMPQADPADNGNLSRRPSQTGSNNSGVMVDDNDIDMGGTAAGLLDQMHTGFSAGSTPLNSFPTPQAGMSGLDSNAGTPANMNVPSPAPNQQAAGQEQKKDQDVNMGNTGTSKPAEQGAAGEDWVVVPKGGVSPSEGAGGAAGQVANPAAPAAAAPKQGSAAGTPAVTEGDANDFSSLGDLDTAGDALAGYGTPGLDGAAGSLGEGLDLNMDMEDSAFGDAFHGVGSTGTPGGQSEGA